MYAGDLLGNVWRVDLTNLTGSGATATNIATLTSPDNTKFNGSTAQPVTTRPVVGTDPETGNRYVFLGTGQLLNDTDLVNPQTETFYAFLDGNNSSFDTTSTFPITRSNLSNDDPSTGVGTSLPSGKRGFYIDLAAATTTGPAQQPSAERVNVQPVAAVGVVGFAANLLGQDVCIKGSSRVFGLNYDTSAGPLGQTLLTNAGGTPVSSNTYLGGLVTNVTLVSNSPSNSGVILMYGLDTTAGGANKTPQSTAGGTSISKQPKGQDRLNWREVPGAQ